MKSGRFTEDELAFMRAHYWTLGPSNVAEKLDRKMDAVATKAWKMGLKVNPDLAKQRLWNDEDLGHFYALDDPFIVYFLGFFWADGTVGEKTFNVKFKIVKPDFDVIGERLRMTAKTWRYREDHDGVESHEVQSILEINHKGLWDFLRSHNYHLKSGASADSILRAIPAGLRHYWWRGYFDGDGSLVFSGATIRVSIASCREQDWSFARTLFERGIAYRIGDRDSETGSSSNLIMEGEASVTKFMAYILQGERFGLERKYCVMDEYRAYKARVTATKTSRYRGVCQWKGRWLMQFHHHKRISVFYNTEEEAARAYDILAARTRGLKAVLNFPDEKNLRPAV